MVCLPQTLALGPLKKACVRYRVGARFERLGSRNELKVSPTKRARRALSRSPRYHELLWPPMRIHTCLLGIRNGILRSQLQGKLLAVST